MSTPAAGPEQIRKMKQRIAGYVHHMSLDDIRKLGDRTYRRAWLMERFGGWSQGLECYLSAILARRVQRLKWSGS